MPLWLTALQVIPWKDVIEATPAVVQGARALWKRSQQVPEDAPSGQTQNPTDQFEREVARLQQEVQEGALLIKSLAEQNAKLVETVGLLRIRTRILIWGAAVQAVCVAGLVFHAWLS